MPYLQKTCRGAAGSKGDFPLARGAHPTVSTKAPVTING